MAVTPGGTPYVESSDLVANYPAASLALANHVDTKSNTASPTFTGVVGVPVLQTAGTPPTLPANYSGLAAFVKGASSPQAGRIYFGDGTGWKFTIGSRASSVDLNLIDITDFGVINADSGPLGPWATYVMSWTAATTNPAIGNGTIISTQNRSIDDFRKGNSCRRIVRKFLPCYRSRRCGTIRRTGLPKRFDQLPRYRYSTVHNGYG